MAESGMDNFAATGSETAFDFYCEFCNENDIHLEAEGYCTVCDEYLCANCVANHKGNRLSRHHQVLDKEVMPKNTPLVYDGTCISRRKNFTTMCKQHKDEPVTYFCKSHDTLACSLCFFLDHRTCTNIVNISDSAQTIFDNTAFKQFIQMLETLKKKVYNIRKQAHDKVTKSEQGLADELRNVDQYRNYINLILDDIERDLKAKVERLKNDGIAKMEVVECACNSMEETLDKLVAEFDHLQPANRTSQTYIRMKESAADIQEIERKISEIEANNTVTTFTFVPNTILTEYLTGPDAFGVFEEEPEEQTSDAIDSMSASSAHFVEDIAVKSTDDQYTCWITGSALVSENKLITVDKNNCMVRLVDTKSKKVVSELSVPKCPWDVAVITESSVAVTIPNQMKVLILKVTGGHITKVKQIHLKGACHGITFTNDQLIVTFHNPAKIKFMNLNGNINRMIDSTVGEVTMFTCPEYISVSNDGETIYISDYEMNGGKIISINSSDGAMKTMYADSELKGPQKLCIDRRGNVLVCGYGSKNIHMISPECTNKYVLLTQEDGLTVGVNSVSHCRMTNRLYVGMLNDKIKVYQLS